MGRMLLIAVTLFCFVRGELVSSRTIYIGDGQEYAVIQDAIDAAEDGDELIVSPGTYGENIEFKGKNIIVRSSNPLDPEIVETTIIDGQGLEPAVTFSGDEGSTCMLSGFTLRNGRGTEIIFRYYYNFDYYVDFSEYWGGGVWGNGTQAQTEYCIIRENQGHDGLGTWGAGSLSHCEIRDNIYLDQTGPRRVGAGIAVRACRSVEYCSISNKKQGGGCAVVVGDVKYNRIKECGGGVGTCGGGVVNNLIYNNVHGISSIYGNVTGNLVAFIEESEGIGWTDAPILNNIVIFNGINGTAPEGGIHRCNGPIIHNIIMFNYVKSVSVAGGIDGCNGSVIANNVIWGNWRKNEVSNIAYSTTPTFCLIEETTMGDDTNSTAAPLLADPAHFDFRLLPTSPGVDDGTSAGVISDLLGNPRPLGAEYDIGAYELTSSSLTSSIRSHVLGLPTTNSLGGSPWPAEWPEEWIEDLLAVELPTTAVGMLSSYTLQVAGASTTAGLDLNQDGFIDIADALSSLGLDAPLARSARSSRQGSKAQSVWRPPPPVAPSKRREIPIESYCARWGPWAEAMWKLDHEKHTGKSPVIIELRSLPAPDPHSDPDAPEGMFP